MITTDMNGNLVPIDDSLPKATWRNEPKFHIMTSRFDHNYPRAGTQGSKIVNRTRCKRALEWGIQVNDERCNRGFKVIAAACACEEVP